MRRWLTVALVGGLAASSAAAAAPEPGAIESAFDIPVAKRTDPYGPRPASAPQLSQEQIERYALENPQVKAAGQRIEAMEAQLRKARFAWIPIIKTETTLMPGVNITCEDITVTGADAGTGAGRDFDFQYCHPPQRNGESLDVQTVGGYFRQLAQAGVRFGFKAEALIPIYTFGKIRNTKRAAAAGVALAKLAKAQAQQETVLLVRRAHTTLLLARESIQILREAWDVVKKARKRVDKDLGSDDFDADLAGGNPDRDPDDRVRVAVAELEVEERMRQARKIEALALAALWALAGEAGPVGFDVAEQRLIRDRVRDGVKDLAHYKKLAGQARPEAKMAAGLVELRRAQEKLARSRFLPDLGVIVVAEVAVANAADRDMSELYYRDRFNYSRLTAALAMRWRWDFHNHAFDLQKSRAELRASEYRRDAARLLLERDVEQAFFELDEAHHKIAIATRGADLRWQLVVSQQQRDSVGGGDSRELLRALERWYEWRFKLAEAIQLHNVALAQLSRAVGTPLIQRTSGAARPARRPKRR